MKTKHTFIFGLILTGLFSCGQFQPNHCSLSTSGCVEPTPPSIKSKTDEELKNGTIIEDRVTLHLEQFAMISENFGDSNDFNFINDVLDYKAELGIGQAMSVRDGITQLQDIKIDKPEFRTNWMALPKIDCDRKAKWWYFVNLGLVLPAVWDNWLKQCSKPIERMGKKFKDYNSNQIMNTASLRFKWAKPVQVDQIKLFNTATKDQYVQKVRIDYVASDGNFYDQIPMRVDIPKSEIGSEGKPTIGSAIATGPGYKIKELIVRIDSAVGDEAGLSEININGSMFVNEPFNENTNYLNLARYAKVVGSKNESFSSTLSETLGSDIGKFRSMNAFDPMGTKTQWVSNGNGNNTYMHIKLPSQECIESVQLFDIEDKDNRFTQARIRFQDSNANVIKSLVLEKSKDQIQTDLVKTDAVNAEYLYIELTKTTGKFPGLSDIYIRPCQ